jgi:biopolymer transport protein ExbD
MIGKGGLERKNKAASQIPSSSLADMAFLLLIFFMVTTVFRRYDPREYEPPEAAATQRLDTPRRDVLHIYIERDGNIFINDAIVPPAQVGGVVGPLYLDSQQRLVIVLRADRDVPYRFVDQVQKELQEARAVRVTFYTNLEQRITRERR